MKIAENNEKAEFLNEIEIWRDTGVPMKSRLLVEHHVEP